MIRATPSVLQNPATAILAGIGALLGGLFSYALIRDGGLGRWIILFGFALFVLGLLHPGWRLRVRKHLLALCLACGGLVLTIVTGLIWIFSLDSHFWIFEAALAALGGFLWIVLGLQGNRKYPEAVPFLLSIGAVWAWDWIQSMQIFRSPLSGLFGYYAALGGACGGALLHYRVRSREMALGGSLAFLALALGTSYALFVMPPGSPRSLRMGPEYEETGYICYGDGDGVDITYVLRLGEPDPGPITVLYNNWMSDDYATLTRVTDPVRIEEAYRDLGAQDEKRFWAGIESGKVAPVMRFLWPLRRVPRRGSIWIARLPDGYR